MSTVTSLPDLLVADGRNRTGTGMISGHPEPAAGGGEGAEGTCARRALWEEPNWLTSPQRGSRQRCCAAPRHFCLPRVPAVKTRLSLVSNSWTQDFRKKKFKIKSGRHVFRSLLFCTCRIRTVFIPKWAFLFTITSCFDHQMTSAWRRRPRKMNSLQEVQRLLSFKDRKWLIYHCRLVTLISDLFWQPPAWTVPLIADLVWVPDQVYGFSFTKRMKKVASCHWWI